MKAARDFFKRDKNDPYTKKENQKSQQQMMAGLLAVLYGFAVVYGWSEQGPLPPSTSFGGNPILVMGILAYFFVYFAGRVFCRHWVIAEIVCISLISAATFLPFIL